MKAKSDLLQGTLHLLVLQALAPRPLHGLGAANWRRQLEVEAKDWQVISVGMSAALRTK